MPSLLIIAHGSRRAASNDEVRQLAVQVRAQAGNACDEVETAYMELAEPSIPEGLGARGATEIVAFPCFLAVGTHVAQDIPGPIAEFTAAQPAVKVRVTPHLGASATLPAAILGVAA
jgi:sirohydrochlorin ferrochelatase